ncbi:hypothetical protein BN2476_350081 [Paraburkholderia piptadeniae]|uniref:Uncharacterized protein n=1 Tax=Paraburkholderia piptadeniae TaxID=1701573 RepID=A0A1N7S7T9_9BURK|nr:hypothetical protein BN2476_350081 [Paraburkholderia piptadeniae]
MSEIINGAWCVSTFHASHAAHDECARFMIRAGSACPSSCLLARAGRP